MLLGGRGKKKACVFPKHFILLRKILVGGVKKIYDDVNEKERRKETKDFSTENEEYLMFI